MNHGQPRFLAQPHRARLGDPPRTTRAIYNQSDPAAVFGKITCKFPQGTDPAATAGTAHGLIPKSFRRQRAELSIAALRD